MGEAKQRADIHAATTALVKELIDKGLLIEAGYASFIQASFGGPDKMGNEQLYQLRMAFFAGAQHLHGSIMTTLDPGGEPTEADLNRLTAINDELNKFITEFIKNISTEGSA